MILAIVAASLMCGGFRATVRPSVDGGVLRPDTVHIARVGSRLSKVIGIADERSVRFQCLDVTGDGHPELIVTNDGTGAHCCAELRIVQLFPRVEVLLDVKSNGAGSSYDVEDLGHDGRHEVVMPDDHFAYQYDLSFADSPAPPLILCYAKGWVDCTRRFPAAIQEFLADAEQRSALKDIPDDQLNSAALAIFIAHTILGDANAWELTMARAAQSGVWLAPHRAEIERWASDRLGPKRIVRP